MNIVEFEDLLHAVETRHDLLAPELDGWSAWPVLRMAVKLAMCAQGRGSGIDRRNAWPWRERFVTAWRDLSAVVCCGQAPELLVLSPSSARAEVTGGRYRDVYFDDLLMGLPRHQFFKIESINSREFISRSRNALLPSNATTTAINLSARMLRRSALPLRAKSLAHDFYAVIRDELSVSSLSPARIQEILLVHYWQKCGYACFLRRLHPRRLLLTNAYCNHAIVAAAREQDIEIIELQHGVLGLSHVGYSWPASAVCHKSKMPIPHRLWLYGDFWRKDLLQTKFWQEQELRAVGSLRMDAYRHCRIQGQAAGDDMKLLVTTQGVDQDALISFLREFLLCARTRSLSFSLVIKMHHRERNPEVYRHALAGKEVTVLENDRGPSTYELLAEASLHASVYSTCHYDALGLGLPTVILPLAGHEIVMSLHRAGWALLAETPLALVDLVASSRRVVPGEVGRQLFQPDALRNMRLELGLPCST